MEKKDWLKAVNEAIFFVGQGKTSIEAVDILFTGRVDENELDEEETKEYQRLKNILGKDVIDYLGSKQVGSFSGGGGLPLKTIKREARERRKEYARIMRLTPDQLRQEAEKYATEMREEEN